MQVTDSTKFLAQEILDYLERFPERHNQITWIGGQHRPEELDKLATAQLCNSTMCVAGTAVFLTTPLKKFKSLVRELDAGDIDEDYYEDNARDLLGLSYDEAHALFYSEENEEALDMLRAVAEGDQSELDRLREVY